MRWPARSRKLHPHHTVYQLILQLVVKHQIVCDSSETENQRNHQTLTNGSILLAPWRFSLCVDSLKDAAASSIATRFSQRCRLTCMGMSFSLIATWDTPLCLQAVFIMDYVWLKVVGFFCNSTKFTRFESPSLPFVLRSPLGIHWAHCVCYTLYLSYQHFYRSRIHSQIYEQGLEDNMNRGTEDMDKHIGISKGCQLTWPPFQVLI